MTPKEFANHLRGVRARIIATRERDAYDLAFDTIALVEERIQDRGEDSEGVPFVGYTPNYAKYGRDNQGYQFDYVDFTRTGRLWANIGPVTVRDDEEVTIVDIKARNRENQNKLNGQFRKRGNILLPSDAERQLVLQAYQDRVDRIIDDINNF